MNAYTDAIASLEQELEQLAQRQRRIELALGGLRELAGDTRPLGQKKSGRRALSRTERNGTERNGTERSKNRADWPRGASLTGRL